MRVLACGRGAGLQRLRCERHCRSPINIPKQLALHVCVRVGIAYSAKSHVRGICARNLSLQRDLHSTWVWQCCGKRQLIWDKGLWCNSAYVPRAGVAARDARAAASMPKITSFWG